MIHWNAHLVCNWLHSQPAESFLFRPCDVGRPSNSFALIEAALVESARSVIKATAGHATCCFMNKKPRLLLKMVPPPPPPPPLHILPSPTLKPGSHFGLSLTAIVSGAIKSREGREKKEKMLQHLSWAQPQAGTHTKRTRHTAGEWMLLLIPGPDVWGIAQIQKLGHKRCFLSFNNYNCSATPGEWLTLYLDSRSIQPWNRLRGCFAIFSLIRAAPQAPCVDPNSPKTYKKQKYVRKTICNNFSSLPDYSLYTWFVPKLL